MHVALHVSSTFIAVASLDGVPTERVRGSMLNRLILRAVADQSTDTTLYFPLRYFPDVKQVHILQLPKTALCTLLDAVGREADEVHVVVDSTAADHIVSLAQHPSDPGGVKVSVRVLRSLLE